MNATPDNLNILANVFLSAIFPCKFYFFLTKLIGDYCQIVFSVIHTLANDVAKV
jgi:hypothetical protein